MERDTVYPANVDEKETEQEEDRSANVTNEEIDISEFHESYQLDLVLSQLVRQATPLSWHPNEPRHINELNEHCMQNIFEFFPSQSLIQLRGVCRKWFWDIHRLIRSKRSIKIVEDKTKENFCYCQDLPKYFNPFGEFKLFRDHFIKKSKYLKRTNDDLSANPSAINALHRLFPNITRLVVCIYRDKFMYNMYTVFPMWSKLEVLTLLFYNVSPECLHNLWSNIDMLSGLKELHLLGMKFGIDVPPNINTLRQLEAFTLLCKSEVRQKRYLLRAKNLLSQLGPQLRRLFLYGIYLPLGDFESFCRSNSSTVNSLTRLTIGKVAGNNERSINYQPWCRLIATHMTSLTYFKIKFGNPSPFCSLELLHELSELKLLEGLSLSIFRTNSMTDIKERRQLPSVKRLWLTVEEKYNPQQFIKLISFIFPSLEFFHILSNIDDFLGPIRQFSKSEAVLRRYFPRMQPRNFLCGNRQWNNLDDLDLCLKKIFRSMDIPIFYYPDKIE